MSIGSIADRQTPESSQRRHLTVMFCDVVGATHLSGERDVETYFSMLHAYYSECRPVVERHGGLIAQHQGDGIYVWFGYPLPKGDDATRAVRAGLDLLVVLRRLSARLEAEIGEPLAVRIAVHAGEVLVAPVTGEPTPLAFGHTPNLAAKLQQAALPGTLVVSGEVLQLVADSFDVQAGRPAVLADGSVVPVYEVVKERHRQGRVGRSWRTPMVDRDRERAHLQRIWISVQAGQGAVVALVGGRGIGKTRLAATVLSWAVSTRARVLDCACNHLDTSTAYRPLRTMLAQAIGIEPDDPPIVAAGLLQDHLDGLRMDPLAVTLLATVLGLPPQTAGPAPDLTPSKLAELTAGCLVEWVTRLTSTPTVLLVDDITDADPSSLSVLAQLAATPPPRLLLVLTARSDVAPPPFLAGDTIEIIEVTPLPGEVCEALVDAVTEKSPISPQARQQVLAQGDGIPLFIEELTRSVQEGRHMSGLPITLTGHLQARLAAPGIDREVAGALAVADHDLDESVLGWVLGADPQELRDRLSGLLASDLVVNTGGPGCRYRFRHGLITEAAYSLLLREQRTRFHSLLADALARPRSSGQPIDWNVVGRHLRLAGRPVDACEAVLTGVDEASRAGAFQEALQGGRDALDIITTITDPDTRHQLEVRCRSQKGLIALAVDGFGSEEAAADYERCATLCRQLPARAEYLSAIIGTFVFYVTSADLAAARRIAENLRSWVDASDIYHRAESTSAFAALSFFEGNYQEAGELFNLVVNQFVSRPSADRGWFLPYDIAAVSMAIQAVICWFSGRSQEAQETGARAIARAATLDFPLGPFSMAFVKSYLGWANAVLGDYETAARLASEVRDIGHQHGFVNFQISEEIHLAVAQYRINGRVDAVDTVEQNTSIWERHGGRIFLSYPLAAAADIRARMGQHAEALAGFAVAGQFVQETGICFYEAERLRLLGGALHCVGKDPHEALHQAWALAQRQGALLFELRAAIDLARLTADPDWAARLRAAVRRFPPGAAYPELGEAQTLLARPVRHP